MTSINKLDPITSEERTLIAAAAGRATYLAHGYYGAARVARFREAFRATLPRHILALVAIRNYQLQPRRRRWWWLVRSCWGG